MGNNVFDDKAYNTPMDAYGWNVQNSATGTDQNLTGVAGVTGASLATKVVLQPTTGQGSFTSPAGVSASGQGSFAGTSGDATAAKLSDLKAVAALVDSLSTQIKTLAKLADLQTVAADHDTLNAAMRTAGLEATS